jgi:hypothetical protein
MESVLDGVDSVGAIRRLLGLAHKPAALLVDYLGSTGEEEPSAELLGEFLRSARTRLGKLALGRASAKPDRHGGFKAVYFDEDRVLAVTKPLRASTARQALIELLVQYAMHEAGHAVPAVYAAQVRVCSTPTVGLFQVISHSERMQATLAEYLVGAAYAALDAKQKTNAVVVVLCAVCRTLARLHDELQIRHGDLKPDNIMQRNEQPSKKDPTRVWALIDFGQVRSNASVGGDLFFLLWWLAHVYAKYVPQRLLRVLRAALKVPESALDAVRLAPSIEAADGVVDFSKRVSRAGQVAEDAWTKQYGITKTELYSIQRSISVPSLEPTRFAVLIRKLYEH